MTTFLSGVQGYFNQEVAKFKENPSEYLKANTKTIGIAVAFFASLCINPIVAVGGCIGGFLYSKNIRKIEDELVNFVKTSQIETQCVAYAILGLAFLTVGGRMALYFGLGAYVGSLLSDKYTAKES